MACHFSIGPLQESTKQQHAIYSSHQQIYLISMPAVDGVLKLDTIRWRRRLKACSISLASDAGSIRQNDPLPGSSWDLGTFTKKRFSERLCRIEFYNHTKLLNLRKLTCWRNLHKLCNRLSYECSLNIMQQRLTSAITVLSVIAFCGITC